MTQLFDQVSADGIIVIGVEVKICCIVQVVQLDASGNEILPV
jgi:hypothetical protein